MIASATKWVLEEVGIEEAQKVAGEFKISPLLARLLLIRGIKREEEIESFLHPERFTPPSPDLLPDLIKGKERIRKAVEKREKIWVYGDYDTDGVMSATLLYHLLKRLGADFSLYIPNRFQEGYGLHKEAVRKAGREGVRLLITVDTGVSAVAEVEEAKALGIDVIITDHHEPPRSLPAAYAVINPKRPDSPYPHPALCGAGVALKLAQALIGEVPEEWWSWAAIGTIADLVPLLGENRYIAYRGLKALSHADHPGLLALLEKVGLQGKRLDAGHVAFIIAPRINAAGRMEDASLPLKLFTTAEMEEAFKLAERLEELNQRRQALVEEIYQQAEEEALHLKAKGFDEVLLVSGEAWHEGVIGIVASRLVERFHRPAFVLAVDPQTKVAKGSARSIPGFDLYRGLTEAKDLLLRYGGHTMAAGLSIHQDRIDDLRRFLCERARELLTEEDYLPKTRIDLEVKLSDLTIPFAEELERLAPFGVGNPEPLFLLRGVEIESIRRVGREGDHLKWRLKQDNFFLDGIAFRQGEKEALISPSSRVHFVGQIGIQEWNGRKKLQFYIQDLAIPGIQVFDRRGSSRRLEILLSIPDKKRQALLYFHKRHRPFLEEKKEEFKGLLIPVNRRGEPLCQEVIPFGEIKQVILYDLPETFASLRSLRLFPNMEELWLLSGEEEREGYPRRLPSREEFIRFYSILHQRKGIALDGEIWDIGMRNGFSREILTFILKVFHELRLVRVEGGTLRLGETLKKRSFEESPTYRWLKESLAVEEALLFSTPQNILEWLIQGVGHPGYEEGIG
ncbi:single-stranded-DNA-specific exonuclease RecJ [Thermicanus aegyptius]|uniref:single-stranded-DNA-specific exonuclease RecJ n=1 Tax=Thermicanus aegyptius TaxID=94009 RepID=UPI0003F7B069|nr:single-stranded-DNA-specific exonuclease RecJ [Thermicanus aegyptius]